MTRAGLIGAGVLLATLALGPAAAAVADAPAAPATQLLLGPPRFTPASGELELVLAPARADGGRAALERVRVTVDGAALAVRQAPLLGQAAAAGGAAAGPRPSLALGLVFSWGEGAPQEILDGVPRLLRPLPAQTRVHPVPYGEGLPAFVTPRTAADLRGGDLDLVAPIAGSRPVLVRAIDAAASAVLKDRATLPFLFVVTDGIDHEQSDPMAFFQLGRELRRRGLLVTVVSFPAATTGGRDNAAHLAAGAEGRHLAAPARGDLPAYLEGAGLAFLDLSVVTVRPGLRLSGGSALVGVGALVEGEAVQATAPVWLPGSSGVWLGGAGVALGMALLLAFYARGERTGDERTTETPSGGDEPDSELAEASTDPAEPAGVFDPAARGAPPSDRSRTAAALAALVDQPIDGALVALRERLGDDAVQGLGAWSFAETAGFLRRVQESHPELGTRQGRQWLLALQDALVQDGTVRAVAWIVRTAGPGVIGETLRLGANTPLPGAVDAVILAQDRGFVLVEGQGGVRRRLRDGEAFAAGSARYVFKSVT